MSKSLTIRVYSPHAYEPVTDGASFVISEQIAALRELGHKVQVVTWKSTARETPLRKLARIVRSALTETASPELYYYGSDWEKKKREITLPVDLAIYHYSFSYLAFRQPVAHEKKRVVYFHNLESDLFRLRGAAQAGNVRKLEAHERALADLADELWFISLGDLEDYQAKVGARRAVYRFVPPTFRSELRARSIARRIQTEQVELGMIGRYDFEPNRASLEWVVTELAPQLERAGFSGKIWIAGRSVPESLRAQASKYSFFEWMGFVPDAEDFWSRLSFLLVPHICGSGSRIKLLEAVARGVPVLANSAAVRAVDPNLIKGTFISVRNSPLEWAELVISENARNPIMFQDNFPRVLSGDSVYDFL